MAIRLAGDKVANRAFVIGPDGVIIARYDKLHMFDVDLGEGESYRESRLFEAGASAIVVRLPFASAGLSICYDVRFPQLYRSLAKAGASLLTIPSRLYPHHRRTPLARLGARSRDRERCLRHRSRSRRAT